VTTVVKLDLEDDLLALLQKTNQPLEKAAHEMIVLELYRRGSISSGRAAGLLGMPRMDFIHYASRLGIPYIDMTKDEWEAEKAALDAWPRS
jgi:predicted HTH domain antitoxin